MCMVRDLLSLTALLAFVSAASAASIGLNVGTNMGAAAIAGPGDIRQANWNDAAITVVGSQIAWASTVDSDGAATAMTAVFNITGGSGGTGGLGSGGTNDTRMFGADIDLFDGSSGSPNGVLSVSGVPYARYNVYVYLQPDDVNRVAATEIDGRTEYMRMLSSGAIPADGSSYIESDHTTAPVSGADALNIPQAHFVKFELLSSSDFTANLWGDLSNNGTQRFRVAGFQIEEQALIPEPSTLALLGMGLVGLISRRRRCKKRTAAGRLSAALPGASLSLVVIASLVANSAMAGITNYWPLNEGAGTTTANLISGGNAGTINNAATGGLGGGGKTWVVDGTRGNVLSFNGNDGSGAYVATGTLPQAEVNGDFTWTFWANLQASGTGVSDVVLGNRFGGPGGRWSKFTPTQFEWQTTAGNGNVNIADIPFDGQWDHHAIVKSGTSFQYYLNGVAGASATYAGTHSGDLPFFIGGDAGGERPAGLLDDIATFDEALNATQIAAIMAGNFMEFGIGVVPEPSTFVLLGMGLVGLTARRQRSGHKSVATRPALRAFAVASVLALLCQGQLSATPYNDAVLADNPIAYWQFDEPSGTTATDTSVAGANHPGTNSAGVTVNQASLHSNLNSSYRFNGTSGVVTVPDHADFNLGTGAISIEWWFNAAGAGAGTRGDFFTYKGGTGDFGIHFDATGQIDVYHTAFIQDGGASVSRDAWHHVVFTKEAGTAANNATLYLDGGVYANFTDTQSFTIPGNILFGSNTGALFFNGRLDEFAIYNTALSAFDVAQHYAAATAVPVPEPSTFALLGMGLVGLNVRRRRKSPSRKAGGTGVQNVVTRNVAGLAAALVLALWAAGSQAAFLTPVGVTANGNIDANAVIANTINHNGLTAVGTHSSTFATQNFWRTNSAAGTLSITYDLGAQFNLNSMRIWNYNESGTGGGGAPNTDRGINNLTVSYSKDNVEFFKAEDFSLAQASGLATYSGQVKNFGKINTGVRYVKFDVIDSHGSNNGLTGLSEVRFNTTNAEIVPTSVTVNQTANGGATFGIENLTNDSGMIGFGNEQSDEADGGNGFAGQWRQSTGGGNVLANSQITFDLGTNRTIGAIKIWNFHESGQTDRGIDEIDLYQSDDGISYSLIGNYDLTQQTGAQSVLHDVIDLNGLGVSAQFLRFDVAGNFGDGGFYGLGEVRFFAAAATIPEPGSLLLLCLGLAGLATRRPSRIRSGAGR